MAMSQPIPTCDVCGGGVSEDERTDAALTLADTMCPSPMTFHRSCFEGAQEMLGNTSDTLNCEAPADDERGQEIERLLDQVFRSRTE